MRFVTLLLVVLAPAWFPAAAPAAPPAERPNILFILADDLGYGDLGCYGQQRIATPRLDRLAREGMRFTQAYAGSTVCAPSRCALMTGRHTGHCRVRGNALVPLEPEDVTVAEVLRSAGYRTGIVGKWGLGEPDTTGLPNRQGFDTWFGYLNQAHAHDYFPQYLWRNTERVELAGNQGTAQGDYTPDLMEREAVAFLRQQTAREPFFLYLALTLPHANNELGRETGNGMEIPDAGAYRDEPWPAPQRNHAAMITRLDTIVGAVLDTLAEQGLAENTIVFFTSDNGPHQEGGADPKFFQSSGPLRGIKRDLYEGGIRVPLLVRWPGHIAASSTSDLPTAFWDFLPTAAELASATTPADVDGMSILPTLLGAERAGRAQPQRDYLYWEFHERGTLQAIRSGDWKVVRRRGGKVELYDLATDPGESRNVAAAQPAVVARLEQLLDSARTDSPHWPIKK
ncbi:MAG: arylsulfatase [Planctomycetaceae bacterium]|nr:arylsulfatase [Planctomycetaceae bacterium]